MSSFTHEQQKVIDLRDRDILVSAAAGSGKTTVLVERIIKKITDEKKPVDIDRILVVTFTRAAAKEMRERIRSAIDKELLLRPDDERLNRQASYVFHSQITTIDSFCNYLLKNYFHRVGAEPDFRIGDARELSLISSEVMDQLMEEHYAAGDEDFLSLIDTYSVRNRDDAVCDMIRDLYTAASATPWQDEWLMGLLSPYENTAGEDWYPKWLSELFDEQKKKLFDVRDMIEGIMSQIDTEAPDHPYRSAIASDRVMVEHLISCKSYDELSDAMSGISYEALSRKKYDDPVPGFKDGIKATRDRYKKQLLSMAEECLFQSRAEACAAMERVGKNVKTLIALTTEYSHRFLQKKQERNVLDFSDIEHLALDILVDRETKKPTEIALELREYFDEILIDEYQDSNYLQETILNTISREASGDNNYFMVGDVKQSIYAFRQARPEIFADKYGAFSTDDTIDGEPVRQQRIDLDKNFRSRREVIDSVNAAFFPLMDGSVGGVDYDEAATLKFGAEYYPDGDKSDYVTEVMLAERDADDVEDEAYDISGSLEYDGEGRMIASRIRELMRDFQVSDRETGGKRSLRYSDIVILMRGVKGRGNALMETLLSFGIPAHVTDESGYFETVEVETVLSLLSVLDNPRQDIPLCAVMHSPIFSYTNEELALIRASALGEPFYRAVFSYRDESLKKHERFLDFIERYRQMINDTPIHKVLQAIYSETGYRTYVRALPGGDVRAANLDRLVDLAVDYEKTSFKGCFKFVNYIRQLKKYNQDVGTAELLGEDDDAVRIMTIHKSKGLEFPVVFLSGINKKFNLTDASGAMVLSPQAGLALEDIDGNRRTKSRFLYKSYLRGKLISDTIGEEMRILYVAMTRAKEKLIITGTYKEDDDFLQYEEKRSMSFSDRIGARSYADFLYPTVFSDRDDFKVSFYPASQLVFDGTEEAIRNEITREDVEATAVIAAAVSEEIVGEYERLSGFEYKKSEVVLKAKYSVSELKHRSMEAYYDAGEVMISGSPDGAIRGTAMHLFMEHFDFAGFGDEDAADYIDDQIALMMDTGHMTDEQAELLDKGKLLTFAESELCRRMSAAAAEGLLFVEKPFVMGESPAALLSDYYADEKLPSVEDAPMLLVQGIIDAFFVEDDEIVLVDYKTDRVKKADELVGRYKKQMELYADALDRGLKKNVAQRIIYSFSLGCEVLL